MDRKFYRDTGGCLVATIAMLAIASAVCAHGAEVNLYDATCRLTAPGGTMGTGCVIQSNSQYVAVLTNAHVVAGGSSMGCDFWSAGYQSARFPGQVLCS